LSETRNIIERERGQCATFVGDISRSADVERLVSETLNEFPTIDILHNNIGIMIGGDVIAVSEADWDRAFQVNLKTMFLTCRAIVPRMIAQGSGVIINVGSIAGAREFGGAKIAYATSKAAVEAFTRSLAVSYGQQGIRAVTITPGIIDTPIFAKVASEAYGAARNGRALTDLYQNRSTVVPVGRLGTAWDIAAAGVFLGSDDAAYITGINLIVDGGLSCIAP